ncbi:MAG: hypothetical protein ACU84Q_10490 [Gammaproteobacteria bacterium]
MQKLLSLGPLRIALLILTSILIVAALFTDGKMHMHSWRLFPNVIAPSLAMMVFFVLPLDITMSCIFKSSSESAAERERLAFAIKIDALVFALLLLAWLPFMLRVLDVQLF